MFWPGADRAGDLFTGAALVSAMVRVEQAWLDALVSHRVAPPAARVQPGGLSGLMTPADVPELGGAAEGGGHPVIPLLGMLRARLAEHNGAAATWLHRGLTSQDVLDTALQLCTRDTLARIQVELKAQVDALAGLAVRHERSVMAGRTLTQHAVPTSFGMKAAAWLTGVLDARDEIDRVAARVPAQLGGAAGTLSALVELARGAGLDDPPSTAAAITSEVAQALGLRPHTPWHTSRAPVTRAGDALVTCTDAWGHLANDVLALTRPELGELAEPRHDGRGGSSTMPQKVNPVLSVLIRRAALTTPQVAATLHLAAAESVDERSDGAWHTEWAPLRDLARRTVVAASQTSELLTGLQVNPQRMRHTARSAAPALLAEKGSLDALLGRRHDVAPAAGGDADPAGYLGASEQIIDAVIARARDPKEDA